ncbi:S8 family peptidase [Actinomyces bowdenii]|uniref:S8 family peptidase n=1 Tax=Actinomyces bowdenii TaxID=131109 RepID=A0A853EJX6_9ACTO|nr:S8 family peptidase [Actinomyces bowdenii]MBF0696339.1 S8 family peptidase [Actinomyces bowdenii]NYS68512.1 S8 family peptidase [Actinomyces bowdenii]
MSEPLRLDHLYVTGRAESKPRLGRGGGKPAIRAVDRQSHGKRLIDEIDKAFALAQEVRESQNFDPVLQANGTYLTLEGVGADFELKLDSLTQLTRKGKTSRKSKWLLLSVHPATDASPERANIWVADDFRHQFFKLFEDYLTISNEKGRPKNNALVANISSIRETYLKDLWTSKGEIPDADAVWWEIWLDRRRERPGLLQRIGSSFNLEISEQQIRFGDSVIVHIYATRKQLELLVVTDLPIAEIRAPSFIDTIEDLSDSEQSEYVLDLAARITPGHAGAPAVCHIDSGVFRTHNLIKDSLESIDQHSIFSPGNLSHLAHGTSMAGIALYGEHLDDLLLGTQMIRLRHRLESVEVFPHPAGTPECNYASATIQAVSLPEITATRQRSFCMPLSTKSDTTPGQPTLWSATVDALAVGTDIEVRDNRFALISKPDPDAKRLIIVSAANVDSYTADHLANSDTSPIEDPGQSWNALTVGAFTQLDQIPSDPSFRNYSLVASAGELSPHSRTSLLFGDKPWPIKPEICLEGGNVLLDKQGFPESKHPRLSLRSTGIKNDVDLTSANATSAATAQAARLAALTMSRYPSYWPETVRALLVHEARWTERMREHVDACGGKKTDRARILRRYGWGVPTEEAVLTSSHRAVTMVVQDEFHPFDKKFAMRELRLHSLPWPRDVLQTLGDTDVRLRITLSYFIEPSATRRGWKGKYTYASYGLRFDLQAPTDINVTDFLARVNRQARTEEDGSPASSSASHQNRWLLGTQARHCGSLHQDEWLGSGAELAACNHIAVYPVGGWWKNNNRRDRRDLPVRYALLVSLSTSAQGTDLYTPIATQLSVPVTAVPVEL